MSTLDGPYRLLRDLRNLLGLQQSFGIEGYPKSEALSHFLKAPPPSAQPVAAPVPSPTSDREEAKGRPQAPDREPERAIQTLEEIRGALGDCCRCSSPAAPCRIIFGAGNPKAALFIVGDAPTLDDEASGSPFSGEAGELLTKMLKAIGLSRNDVYLTTIVKCRPAGHDLPAGAPVAEQIKACLPILISQIEAVNPKVICAMGGPAAQALLHTQTPLVRLRGSFHDYHHRPLMPTFDPGFLLKNPEMKRAVWGDLQLIQARLGLG
jgi:uracil-DNA glycosylase family 4